MLGVEAAVRKLIAHCCDILPADHGLSRQQCRRDGLDGLADLQQANVYGVEHQPVGQVPAGEMGPDRGDGRVDVVEALIVVPLHSGTRSPSTAGRTFGFKPDSGMSHRGTQQLLQLVLHPRNSE